MFITAGDPIAQKRKQLGIDGRKPWKTCYICLAYATALLNFYNNQCRFGGESDIRGEQTVVNKGSDKTIR